MDERVAELVQCGEPIFHIANRSTVPPRRSLCDALCDITPSRGAYPIAPRTRSATVTAGRLTLLDLHGGHGLDEPGEGVIAIAQEIVGTFVAGKSVAEILVLHYGGSQFVRKRVLYAHTFPQLTIAQILCPEHIAS